MFVQKVLMPQYKIVVSKFAYEEKTKVVTYGIADSRRPNNKKPLYRRKVVRTRKPLIMRMGDTIVCAPEIEEMIRKQIGLAVEEEHKKMMREYFGLPANQENNHAT